MKTLISSTLTVIAVALVLWILLSWANVLANNGPYDDGEPASWNAFVVLTEAAR